MPVDLEEGQLSGGQSPAPSASHSDKSNNKPRSRSISSKKSSKNEQSKFSGASMSEQTRSIKDIGDFSDDFQVFKPENAHQMAEMIEKSGKVKVSSRVYRVLLILLIPVVILSFNAYTKNDNQRMTDLGFTLGSALLAMFSFYFFHIFWILSIVCRKPDKSLFRIYSLNTLDPRWTDMSFTYRALVFKQHPIESISEFSAVMGGIANPMLLVISSYSMAVLICGIASEQHYTDHFTFTFGCILELVGCYGLVLIGTFELDPFNKAMKQFHYLGALLGVCTIIGYFYQTIMFARATNNYAILTAPIVITIIGGCGLFAWTHYGKKSADFTSHEARKLRIEANVDEKTVSKQVTKLSFQNVISEAIFLYSGALSMCLWLMFFEKCNMIDGCQS